MPYTLKFSDSSKIETVVVPDMPPGINTIDTSLSLVGKNYPNYGEKIAQNFLNLLENFSSPLPPENPIEGQLWYDTSDPNSKVLRIMDGTADSTRWPSANGIYQQGTDPKETATAGLKVGDIWVDTQNNVLKIYHSGNWTTVGPSISSGINKTGVEPAIITSNTNTDHGVVITYIDGNAVSITAFDQFVPKTVIDGFTLLKPGINISTNNSSIINGTADTAANLKIGNNKYLANRFLIKDDSLQQVITGKLFFQTPTNQAGSEGRDGIVIDTKIPSNNTYVQFYKYVNDAVILNNTPGGKIIFKTRQSIGSGLINGLTIENQSVAINTSTNSSYALSVNGSVYASGNIVLNSTSSNTIIVNGLTTFYQNVNLEKSLLVKNNATVTNLLTLGTSVGSGVALMPGAHNSLDIGSTTRYFRRLYVSSIGSTGTGTVLYGRVIGNSTGLEKSSEFKLQGQVTAPSFIFAGTGTTATFVTSLSTTAITSQQALSQNTSTLTLLVVDTSTSATYTGLQKISRYDFLKGLVPSGTIMPFSGTVIPDGWLLCDGTSKSGTNYPELFSVIDNFYKTGGTNFNVPDMRYSTTSTNGASVTFIKYIIKI